MPLRRLPAFPRECRLAHLSTQASLYHRCRQYRPTNNQPVTSTRFRSRRPWATLSQYLLSQYNLISSPSPASQFRPLRRTTKEASGRRRLPVRPINTLNIPSILNIQLPRRTSPPRRHHLRTSSRPVARWVYLPTRLHTVPLPAVPAVHGRLRHHLLTMLSTRSTRSISRTNLRTIIRLNSISSIKVVITKEVILSTSRAIINSISSSRDVKVTMVEETDSTEVDGEVEVTEVDEEIMEGGVMEEESMEEEGGMEETMAEEGMEEDSAAVRLGVVVGLSEHLHL